MLNRLTHNLGYKLLALALAVWWWALAQSQQNPREKRAVTVRVQVPHTSQLVLPDEPPTVRVTLRGFRDDLDAFDLNSLTAHLDLSRAVPGKKQQLPVAISLPPNSPVELLDRTQTTVEVMVDRVESRRQKVERKDGEVPDNYQISGVVFNPTEVILRGPTSQLRRVRHVYVRIDVTDPLSTNAEEMPVEAVDDTGAVVPNVTVTPPQVEVTVTLKETRLFFIEPDIVGSPASGFRKTGLDCEPRTVLLSGEPSVLKNLTTIPTEPLDITGARDNVTRRVGLKLPDGVTAHGAERVRVEVQIVHEPPLPATPNDQ